MNIIVVHFNIVFLCTPDHFELRKSLIEIHICYLRFLNLK
jgi:hypothetical protein